MTDSPTYMTNNGRRCVCTRCGAALDLPLPMEIGRYCAQLEPFIEAHRWCVAGGVMDESSTNWRAQFSEREQKEIRFAELYAAEYSHGTTGHNALLLIAKLAGLLDGRVSEPEEPGDRVLSFGRYRGRRLADVLRLDADYVEWLAREGRDLPVRQAARDLLGDAGVDSGKHDPPLPDAPPLDDDPGLRIAPF